MFGDGGGVFQGCERPIAGGVGVGHGLERCERFRGDDEQSFRGIEIARGFGEIGAVDVGYETEGHVALAVMAQGFVGHHRPEIGTADADIDDVADALAGVALPFAAAHAI